MNKIKIAKTAKNLFCFGILIIFVLSSCANNTGDTDNIQIYAPISPAVIEDIPEITEVPESVGIAHDYNLKEDEENDEENIVIIEEIIETTLPEIETEITEIIEEIEEIEDAEEEKEPESEPIEIIEEDIVPKDIKDDISEEDNPFTEILISAIGDVSLASNYVKSYANSFYNYYDLYGAKYFLENVASVFSSDDITIANLESALTDNEDNSIRLDKRYCYKGKKEYANILTDGGIDIVNLENNHIFDYSQVGYDDTIDALETAGIEYFGNGIILIKEVKGVKIGFIGSMGSSDVSNHRLQRLKNALLYLDEQGADIKIVSFHWGIVDEKFANSNQRLLAHFAVDNGADLIIGHHPHVLQGIEIYKDKYIVYSLGNFIFDGNVVSDEEHRTSIIFQQKFILQNNIIVDTEINIIPVHVTSNPSVNNFQPIIVDGERKERILRKIEERSQY